MRAIWKGHIQFSLVTIPIRIYNAIDAAQTISFNLLFKPATLAFLKAEIVFLKPHFRKPDYKKGKP